MTYPAWWQDWRGECVAIIGSGPSVNKKEVAELEDRIHVIAIKSNYDLAPFAEVVYGCDAAWWVWRRGLPEFDGIKLSYDEGICGEYSKIHKVDIDRNVDSILVDTPGRVGSGGNSGFQALNLAVQFGATGILLIGYDMFANGNGSHWYGPNTWPGCSNPIEANFARWRKAFETAAGVTKTMGIDVVNASPKSTMNGFRRATIEQALKGWGL